MRPAEEFWVRAESEPPESVVIDGVEVRRGSRVRLVPSDGRDLFDQVLTGRGATVESLQQDIDGGVSVAVTIDDDPGRQLGDDRYIGHRFFFSVGEIEPVAGRAEAVPRRVLIAGIGNVFMADDGFGVAVAAELVGRSLPAGVEVVDFGIRGMDLAFALQRDYAVAVLVDAMPRGAAPGTLALIEPDVAGVAAAGGIDAHSMDPAKVLGLVQRLGGCTCRILVLGCEPEIVVNGDSPEDMSMELSDSVRRAVPEAAAMIERLVAGL